MAFAASAASPATPEAPAAGSAAASGVPSASVARPGPLPKKATKRDAATLIAAPPSPGGALHAGFAGPVERGHDAAWLRHLAEDTPLGVSVNGGGSSITLRIQLADGKRAVFKPHQKQASSNWRAEIAAYHLDRLLGFGRTAPSVSRAFSLAWLRDQLGQDPAILDRIDREVLAEGDVVWGALIGWHERPLVVAEPPAGWIARMSPKVPLAERDQEGILALSDLVLFDTLIDNTDRWSGGNVMSAGPGGPIVFLDNASAFLGFRSRRNFFLERPLAQVCRLRRATVEALRAAGPEAPSESRLAARLGRSLALDPGRPLLGEADLAALDLRLGRVLGHIERCVAEHEGEALLGPPAGP